MKKSIVFIILLALSLSVNAKTYVGPPKDYHAYDIPFKIKFLEACSIFEAKGFKLIKKNFGNVYEYEGIFSVTNTPCYVEVRGNSTVNKYPNWMLSTITYTLDVEQNYDTIMKYVNQLRSDQEKLYGEARWHWYLDTDLLVKGKELDGINNFITGYTAYWMEGFDNGFWEVTLRINPKGNLPTFSKDFIVPYTYTKTTIILSFNLLNNNK